MHKMSVMVCDDYAYFEVQHFLVCIFFARIRLIGQSQHSVDGNTNLSVHHSGLQHPDQMVFGW